MRQRGWMEHEQAQGQRGGEPPQAEGRALGGPIHGGPGPRDREGHLQERAGQDPGRGQGQAETGNRGSQGTGCGQGWPVHRGPVDGRLVRELCQGEGPALLPPDLPGVPGKPYQAQYWPNSPGKGHFSGAAEVLQEAAEQREGGAAGEQEAAQGTQRQDGAEHPPNHLLCDELGQGAEADRRQSGRRLCPAQARAP